MKNIYILGPVIYFHLLDGEFFQRGKTALAKDGICRATYSPGPKNKRGFDENNFCIYATTKDVSFVCSVYWV
jgi:hypothetical protein